MVISTNQPTLTAIAGGRHSFPEELLDALGRYRHDVFVKTLGWSLPATSVNDQLEWDEFDRADTVYVILQDQCGNVRGCARLLSTTEPYLLPKLIPDAMQGRLVSDPAVWELSRVAVIDYEGPVIGPDGVDRMKTLLGAVLEEAARRMITRLIGVASPTMMRLYRRKGFRLEPQGQRFSLGDEELQQFSLQIGRHVMNADGASGHATQNKGRGRQPMR